ncbi:MAG: hypothetical protein MN733_40855, partial [Nitrososphaera sp.]|nr:hypothetical protein [Nitrososphaera sp.]
MSTFKVEVVKLPPFTRHPNADTLCVTQIFSYPVIFSDKEGYKEGDLVAYVPVDAVVPLTAQWAFLGDSERSHRIKAKKLRGIFSMGLLTRPPEGSNVGDDAATALGILKYEQPEAAIMGEENEPDPGFIPRYTDIEGYRRYPHILKDGEPVILMEKIHGCNLRATFHTETDRLWMGSHRAIKKPDPNNLWWKVADRFYLESKLKLAPDKIFYGEVFGQVQDLKYDAGKDEFLLRFFDVYDIATGRYLDWAEASEIIRNIGLIPVPELYEGPWSTDLLALAEGKSTIANNVR